MTQVSNNLQFGQCFLKNKIILQQIATIINIENKNVVEIGPGIGNLTEYIINQNYKSLTLYEIDTRFIGILKEKFSNVNIINENCLNSNIDCDVIISNLPYGISSEFCKNLLLKYKWTECVLLLQKEFVEKIYSINNTLGLIFRLTCNIRIIRYINPDNFTPKPSVMSTIIHITKLNHNYNILSLWKFVTEFFAYSRKKLPIKYAPYNGYRPAQLSINQILEIYEQR